MVASLNRQLVNGNGRTSCLFRDELLQIIWRMEDQPKQQRPEANENKPVMNEQ
ncbi:hypothetical protein MKW98_022693 [Papaver atlanticum]|uniref:Uncharacterized protein n=1 Tax=Papaver atlanticum TaxID=357466 RepID=A0AAD4XQ94_9MAGN|nr:hypothetical protein MKW98_022693 [Papaver atlanticum]